MTWACSFYAVPHGVRSQPAETPQFELTPRVCTLAGTDTECKIQVRASWRAAHEESLCLIVPDRPQVRRCWDRVSQGDYTVDLTLAGDVTFELEDALLTRVLASQVVHVVRDTNRYRHRRREPWNIFE
jgi:hypothetical protein